MGHVNIDGKNNLLRDTRSMAVINTDPREREELRSRRILFQSNQESYNGLARAVEELRLSCINIKDDVSQINEKYIASQDALYSLKETVEKLLDVLQGNTDEKTLKAI